jgi:hypothetical protein
MCADFIMPYDVFIFLQTLDILMSGGQNFLRILYMTGIYFQFPSELLLDYIIIIIVIIVTLSELYVQIPSYSLFEIAKQGERSPTRFCGD